AAPGVLPRCRDCGERLLQEVSVPSAAVPRSRPETRSGFAGLGLGLAATCAAASRLGRPAPSRSRPCGRQASGFRPEKAKDVEVVEAEMVEDRPGGGSSVKAAAEAFVARRSEFFAAREAAIPAEILPEELRKLEEEAEAGDEDAQFRLGEAFFNGWEGQASDQAAAATWFVRAAEHGHR
ncbi:unnamed protein product, partial [Polarella glacialis]